MKIIMAVLMALGSTASAAGAQTAAMASWDAFDFGGAGDPSGLSGEVSLGYAADPQGGGKGFSGGGNLQYVIGQITQSVSFKLDRAEARATRQNRELFAAYDLMFNAGPRTYGFITGRYSQQGQAETADEIAKDAFAGFGPGYRIIDDGAMAWRMQAGIGASYLKDGTGSTLTEPGVILSSRFGYAFSSRVFLSNDTDFLKTAGSLRISNDLGLSLRMSDSFATRISYLTDYNDRRADRTDNRVGVSLVMGF